MNYRGKRLFASRLFTGQLWGPGATGGPPVAPGLGATGHRNRRPVKRRRRDTDDDVLLFLLR